MKKLFRSLVAACALLASLGANAGVVWQLNNFAFNDSTSVTGSFEWDAANNVATAWNIVTVDGAMAGVTYSNTSGTVGRADVYQTLIFKEGISQFRLGLKDFDDLDTPSASLVPFSLSTGFVGQYGYLECNNCAPYRFGNAGAFLSAVDPSEVPEPASIALVGLALTMIGAIRRRQA